MRARFVYTGKRFKTALFRLLGLCKQPTVKLIKILDHVLISPSEYTVNMKACGFVLTSREAGSVRIPSTHGLEVIFFVKMIAQRVLAFKQKTVFRSKNRSSMT